MLKVSDKVRIVNYPSAAWNNRFGIIESISSRFNSDELVIEVRFTDGGLARGGFDPKYVAICRSEPTPQELADEYRKSWGHARDIRNQLESQGYRLQIDGNYMLKNERPIENFKFEKTVTTTEIL